VPDVLSRYQAERDEAERLGAELKRASVSQVIPDRAAVRRAVARLRERRALAGPEDQATRLRDTITRIELHPEADGWRVRARCRVEVCSGGEI
jgi:hypothetical protein